MLSSSRLSHRRGLWVFALSAACIAAASWPSSVNGRWEQLPGAASQLVDLSLGFYNVRVPRNSVLFYSEPTEQNPRGLVHLDYKYPAMTPCVFPCQQKDHDLLQIILDYRAEHNAWLGSGSLIANPSGRKVGGLNEYKDRFGQTVYSTDPNNRDRPYVRCGYVDATKVGFCNATWLRSAGLEVAVNFERRFLPYAANMFSAVESLLRSSVSRQQRVSFSPPHLEE